MTYLVTDDCIKCKYTDCVEVCPVDCFYEGPLTLVINPEECIDCGVCVPECPIDAIVADTEEGAEKFLEMNSKYSKIWPVITEQKAPFPEAEEFKGKPNKMKYLEESIESEESKKEKQKS